MMAVRYRKGEWVGYDPLREITSSEARQAIEECPQVHADSSLKGHPDMMAPKSVGREWPGGEANFPEVLAEPLFVKPMAGRRVEIVECDGGFVVVLHTPVAQNTEYRIHKDAAGATRHAWEFFNAR